MEQVLEKHVSDTQRLQARPRELMSMAHGSPRGPGGGSEQAPLMLHGFVLLSQETMPQTSIIFSSILGPSCSGQVQPGMGERGGGASSSGDLIFQDGRLISGSLEALMEHLVPTVDYYPDVSAWAWRKV